MICSCCLLPDSTNRKTVTDLVFYLNHRPPSPTIVKEVTNLVIHRYSLIVALSLTHYTMDLIIPEMSSFRPIRRFHQHKAKIDPVLVHLGLFRKFLTNCYFKFISHYVWRLIFYWPRNNWDFYLLRYDGDIQQKAYRVGSGDQTTSIGDGIWSLDMHLTHGNLIKCSNEKPYSQSV